LKLNRTATQALAGRSELGIQVLWWVFLTRCCRLRVKYMRQCCQQPPSRIRRIALARPTWASLITSRTPVRPRSLSEPINSIQKVTFAVTQLEAEQLPAAIGIDEHSVANRSGADLHPPAQQAVQVGGIQIQVGVTAGFQGPAQEGLHQNVESVQMRLTFAGMVRLVELRFKQGLRACPPLLTPVAWPGA